MNIIIINEFNKLINLIEFNLNESIKTKNNKARLANIFRLKQIKNILSIIKKYPEEINLTNLKIFEKIDGIGSGTINRIKEILKNGFLEELKNFNFNEINNNNQLIHELETIIGIGKTSALQLINKGITSIEDLKYKILNNKIKVNNKILLGLKYEGIFKNNIPRKEIDNFYKIFTIFINNFNKKYKLDDNNKYIFEICGSYRREKESSNDIDILISKLNTTHNWYILNSDYESDKSDKIDTDNESDKSDNETDNETDNKPDNKIFYYLKEIIDELKLPIKMNNNNSLLVDDITDKNIKTKYMGFCKYKDNPIRRIDIRFVPYNSYFTALLYFTGSKEFNTKIRIKANELGYKLSEYNLINKNNNKKIKINSEYDIFKKLKIEYLHPHLR
jgi:DNA polymerase beta